MNYLSKDSFSDTPAATFDRTPGKQRRGPPMMSTGPRRLYGNPTSASQPRHESFYSLGQFIQHEGRPERSELTLAKLFEDYWDASFLQMIHTLPKVSSTPPSLPTSPTVSDVVPYNQYPSQQNDFSISNFTVEVLVNISKQHGHTVADREMSKLLDCVPHHLRSRCRESILKRAKDLTVKRNHIPLCAFCRNNGQPQEVYENHVLRDSQGKVLCPVLRSFKCPRCGATGDDSHTIKYCPLNSYIPSGSNQGYKLF